MRGVSGLLTCTAAGLLAKTYCLLVFSLLCRLCFDTKAKLFAQGGLLTCVTSTFSQVYPKHSISAYPWSLHVILPVMAKAPDVTVYKARAPSPTTFKKASPPKFNRRFALK